MKRYIFLDDQSISVGGTNLTSNAIAEEKLSQILFVPISSLNYSIIEEFKNDFWIIGNITHLIHFEEDFIEKFFNTINFAKIEFDYNYCPFRGNVPHERLGGQKCDCPYGITGNYKLSLIYRNIVEKSKHVFFMSKKQRDVFFQHLPNLKEEKTSILSSCFSKESFFLFSSFKNKQKNEKYAILQGYGGWHSEAKGLKEAVEYCHKNKLQYEVLSNKGYEQHLECLSEYKGLVFLPIIEDTCPRCTIEARLMGLDIITNDNSQHTTEDWWANSDLTESYLKGRQEFFWSIVEKL